MLAHTGGFGWDEVIFLALPVLVVLLMTVFARKKGDPEAEEAGQDPAGDDTGRSS